MQGTGSGSEPDRRIRGIDLSSRAFVGRGGAAVAALTMLTEHGLTPAEAKATNVPLGHFDDAEAESLDAFGETILPGATAAGLLYFIDDQLGRADPLFLLRYLDWTAPFAAFYRQGLAALDEMSQARHGRRFARCGAEQRNGIVAEIAKAEPPGWDGPPAPLFYFAVRNDAVDVVYGTVDGFAKLGVPYMPHIAPAERW